MTVTESPRPHFVKSTHRRKHTLCAGQWNWLRREISQHLCVELRNLAFGIIKDRLLQDAYQRVTQLCRVQLRKLVNQRPYGDAGPLKVLVRSAVDWHQDQLVENLRKEEHDARTQLARYASSVALSFQHTEELIEF